jgi:hypothetical protein
MFQRLFAILFSLAIFLSSCKDAVKPDIYNKAASNPDLFHQASVQLTDVIVYDIFKPPVASRIYTYSYLAAYETIRQQYPDNKTMAGIINQLTKVPAPEMDKVYCFPLAAMKAFNMVGEELTFSKDMWKAFTDSFYMKYKNMGIPDDVYERSMAYGEKVASHILKYADTDKYKQTRSGEKYSVKDEPGRWVPTPPTYASACEPQWNKTRFFTLDSVIQFKPQPCAKYDMNPQSDYYKLLKGVYELSKNLTQEQKDIAYFWDDNAFVTNISGHMMFASKKMTPPGHWIAIAKTVLKSKKIDMMKCAEVYMVTALALHDAFIAAWDEKYKSNRIRPVTVIGRFIDPNWMPFLETPNFPEYVSGHSAISASAGTVLTSLLGDNIPFTDSTEYIYGHGVRSFTSIKQAYRETSDSRVYGGIHYRDGVDAGMKQGELVGNWVLEKLKLGR